MARLLDRDLITALTLFGISALFSVGSSSDPKDWAFPLLANYLVLGISIVLFARVIISAARRRLPDVLRMTREDRESAKDVFVFLVIVLAYMFVMFGLGFWLSSLIMLVLASLYLTLEKSRRNVAFAIVIPICICIVAFVVFTQVFYVPFPGAGWLPGTE